ncbi:hypothetical protein OROGR_031731 [Orobanche gracilis]
MESSRTVHASMLFLLMAAKQISHTVNVWRATLGKSIPTRPTLLLLVQFFNHVPAGNRDRGPPRGEAGTPTSWNRDSSTPAPDESGTPDWAGTQSWAGSSWNKDSTRAPDEAGTPVVAGNSGWAGASGWNKDQSTPAPDAAIATATATATGWDKDEQ